MMSLFECVKKENNYIISDIEDSREKINYLISDLRVDISTVEKKIDSSIVEINIINQYEHGDELVISGDIIPHGIATENCKDIVFNFIMATLKHKFSCR